MSETDQASGDDALLALLYAAGELDEAAALAFESRLADEQAARDALCGAVRLNQAMAGREELVPDPAYRERVRRRLCGRSERRTSLSGYRKHAAFWAVAGAAAAAVVLLSIHLASEPPGEPGTPPCAVAEDAPALPAEADDVACNVEEGPELMTGRHLALALDEENRRKVRAEDRRIVHLEDRPARLRSAPIYRQ